MAPEVRFVVVRGGQWGKGELGEGGRKVRASVAGERGSGDVMDNR